MSPAMPWPDHPTSVPTTPHQTAQEQIHSLAGPVLSRRKRKPFLFLPLLTCFGGLQTGVVLALEMPDIVPSIPAHPLGKVSASPSEGGRRVWLDSEHCFAVVLLGLCAVSGRFCKQWEYM